MIVLKPGERSMNKTAYRWAKEHGVDIIMLKKREHLITSSKGIIKTSSKLKSNHYVCTQYACLLTHKQSLKAVLVLKDFDSQIIKEVAAWHELGHHANDVESEKYDLPILEDEALASAKAIKLMKEFNRWSEDKRQLLLDWYDTYVVGYPEQQPYRHLIELA